MTHIPLHHPIYSPDLPTLRRQLREKASLFFAMFAYSGMAAAKRGIRLPDGVVPGFRASFVNAKLADARMDGRVSGQPNRKQRRAEKYKIKQKWKADA